MADKPPSQFEQRRREMQPPGRPAQPATKRSHHVVLLLMGTMAVGSTAYMLMPRECKPAEPGAIPTVSSPGECPSRVSSSSSHGSSSRSSYYSGGSSQSSSTASTESGSVKRGGFGSSAHAFSSHFSFGG